LPDILAARLHDFLQMALGAALFLVTYDPTPPNLHARRMMTGSAAVV
jgi:hypothetical protein